ncbi:MAG: hypothetical protein LM576_01945 [Thermofilum sp.]|nr:hypothetical protein [Thermofilum sp.]
MEERAYYIVLKRRAGWGSLSFNVGSPKDTAALVKLKGKRMPEVFAGLVNLLSRRGLVIPIKVTEAEEAYSVREDLGPVVGAYVLMLWRARNYGKWERFLGQLLDEKLPGVANAMALFLEAAIDYSKATRDRGRRKRGALLSRRTLDVFSSVLRQFAEKVLETAE